MVPDDLVVGKLKPQRGMLAERHNYYITVLQN